MGNSGVWKEHESGGNPGVSPGDDVTAVKVSPGASEEAERGNETFFIAGVLNPLCFMEIFFLKQLCPSCSPVLETFQWL